MSTSPPRRRDAIEKTAAIETAAVDLVLKHGYDDVTEPEFIVGNPR